MITDSERRIKPRLKAGITLEIRHPKYGSADLITKDVSQSGVAGVIKHRWDDSAVMGSEVLVRVTGGLIGSPTVKMRIVRKQDQIVALSFLS